MKKECRKLKLAAWMLALAVLALTLVFVNLPGTAPAFAPDPQPAEDDGIPVGSQEGQRAPDFTLSTVYGENWQLSAMRGRAVIINLWATWCNPCVKELPYFQTVAEKYPDDVAVLAIHSDLVTDDVKAFLDKRDFTLPFAVDESGEVITSLGGSVMLPQTIVIDRRGVITYNQAGSVDLERLTLLAEAAMGE
jgi:peroxiredoxin